MKVSASAAWVPHDLFALRRELNAQLMETRTAAVIVALWEQHRANFSAVNVSTALVSFSQAAIDEESESCIVDMLRHYTALPHEIAARNAAGLLSSLAKMKLKNRETIEVGKGVFSLVLNQAKSNKNFFANISTFSLRNLLHGFSCAGAVGDAFFQMAEPYVLEALPNCMQDDLVFIASSYSRKKFKSDSVLGKIESRVLRNLSCYEPTSLAHVAYALSTLQMGSERFYAALYSVTCEQASSLTADGMLYFLDAYGHRVGYSVLQIVQPLLIQKCEELLPRELSLLLRSASKIDGASDEFFEKMESCVRKMLSYANCQDLSLFAMAFSRAQAGSLKLFSELRLAICKNLDRIEPVILAMIHHAFSVRGVEHRQFYALLEERLSRSKLDAETSILLIWSMLLHELPSKDTLAGFLARLNHGALQEISWESRNKLIECSAMLACILPELYATLNEEILQAVAISKKRRAQEPPDRSPFQERVEATLSRMGITFVAEEFLDGFRVDILIPNKRVVIEVNGRPHYYRAESTRLNTSSRMKVRILEHMGYKVCLIPHFDWPDNNEKKAQEHYIQKLLH